MANLETQTVKPTAVLSARSFPAKADDTVRAATQQRFKF